MPSPHASPARFPMRHAARAIGSRRRMIGPCVAPPARTAAPAAVAASRLMTPSAFSSPTLRPSTSGRCATRSRCPRRHTSHVTLAT
eukprot:5587268-Prymnesium_polylepis.1